MWGGGQWERKQVKENSSVCSVVSVVFPMWLVHVCGFALRSKCLAVRPIDSVSVRVSFRTGKTNFILVR